MWSQVGSRRSTSCGGLPEDGPSRILAKRLDRDGRRWNPWLIRYRFDVDDGTHAEFEVVLDPQTLELSDPGPALPAWTLLEFHQCPHCPLSPMEHVRCPAAAHLARLVQAFDHLPSHARAKVEVLTDQRTVIHETSVQQGVGALMAS